MDPPIIRFGAFAFEAHTRQLTREGAAIHLSPKAFELLSILLKNRPRALSKGDLHSRLWPDTFVSESNLAGLVKELRRATGDNPRQPRVIRTLHGFGYAFAGVVAEAAAGGIDGGSVRPDVTFWLVGDRQLRLSAGDTVLGRDADATVWFDLPGISRLHARITVSGDAAVMEDLGSTNGTFVAGERLQAPRELQDGDEIRLGPVRLTFRTRRTSARTEVET